MISIETVPGNGRDEVWWQWLGVVGGEKDGEAGAQPNCCPTTFQPIKVVPGIDRLSNGEGKRPKKTLHRRSIKPLSEVVLT